MIRRFRYVLLVIALAGVPALCVWLGPKAMLRWSKYKANRQFQALGTNVRDNLNAVPTLITLARPDAGARATLEFGSCRITLPTPTSHELNRKTLLLTYQGMQVRLMPIHDTAELEKLARDFGFKNPFEYQSAVYHTRISDIESAPDQAAFGRRLLLLSNKISKFSGNTYFAQFDGDGIHGFLIDVDPTPHWMFAEVFLKRHRLSCGIHFTSDATKVARRDVLHFLANFDMTPLPPPSTERASTVPDPF